MIAAWQDRMLHAAPDCERDSICEGGHTPRWWRGAQGVREERIKTLDRGLAAAFKG